MDDFKTLLSVKKLMNPQLVKIDEQVTVAGAAAVMLSENIDSLLITNEDSLKGIITESDIVKRVVAKKIDPDTIKVIELVQEELITVNSDNSIFEARKIMEQHNIHHLIVTENDTPVGIVASKDVIKG